MSTLEVYEDPIIKLANDPDLNREVDKTNQLLELISKFSLAERKVSKLCQLALTILQTLEKIELNLKNWAFLSLDINSNDHFSNDNSHIKQFNNNIAMKVLTECNDLNRRLTKISADMDYITKALRSLSPVEYILDSGTLLTSLTLRNIGLKHELTDKVTVAYLKAKLITIGTELETMLEDDSTNSTVSTYKSFVANLLQQLNNAIDEEDMTEKHECLAVINDMEKMFEAFKLEKIQQSMAAAADKRPSQEVVKDELHPPTSHDARYFKSPSIRLYANSDDDNDSLEYDTDMGSSMYGSSSMYNAPIIHSITKSHHRSDSSSFKNSKLSESHTPDSFMNDSMLHKTTISDEMPYLMSAFHLAKNVEEDIKNFKEEEQEQSKPKHKPDHRNQESLKDSEKKSAKKFPNNRSHIMETPLTSSSEILQERYNPSPYSYLNSNNSLLSRLGFKPQVVTTELPADHLQYRKQKELGPSTTVNISEPFTIKNERENDLNGDDNEGPKYGKENSMMRPLTQKNLANHTFSSLNVTNDFNDQVE